MANLFMSVTDSGAIQIIDSGVALRPVQSGAVTRDAYGKATISGDLIDKDAIIFVKANGGYNAGLGNVDARPGYSSPFTWIYGVKAPYDSVLEYLAVNSTPWSSLAGMGMVLKDPSGNAIFNSSDQLFVLTSVAHITITASDVGTTRSVSVSTYPYSGVVPYVFAPVTGTIWLQSGGTIYQVKLHYSFSSDYQTMYITTYLENTSGGSGFPTSYNIYAWIGVLR